MKGARWRDEDVGGRDDDGGGSGGLEGDGLGEESVFEVEGMGSGVKFERFEELSIKLV